MPSGSTGTFTDKEWANGVTRNNGWETFVARDVVHAIDKRYRTIPSGRARAIGGLSEGGYGSLNIALHHPREFKVIQSWSGYVRADHLRSIFGTEPARLAYNSPLLELPKRAAALRRARTFIWFYSGREDRLHTQNGEFAAALTRARLPHRYFLVRGVTTGRCGAATRDLPCSTPRGISRMARVVRGVRPHVDRDCSALLVVLAAPGWLYVIQPQHAVPWTAAADSASARRALAPFGCAADHLRRGLGRRRSRCSACSHGSQASSA